MQNFFDPSKLTVTPNNGTATFVAGSGSWTNATTFTFHVTKSTNGVKFTATFATGAFHDLAGNGSNSASQTNLQPAGTAGEDIHLALLADNHGAEVTVHVSNLPSAWSLAGAIQQTDGSWLVTTTDVSQLTVQTPGDYSGAEVLDITMAWVNADGTTSTAFVSNNVEAYAADNPIFAWSGDDTLTGSANADTFVFSQPIGNDTVHSFDASADVIDLIGYSGTASFADVQSHMADDGAGNAVITLADGQSITLAGVSMSSLTAANFEFDVTPAVTNSGTITIGNGAMLPLSGTIDNSGTIIVGSTGSATLLQLIQNGITLQGGGSVVMSDSSGSEISGTLPTVTLTNVDNTISGAGNLGGGSLTLINGGTILADGVNALIIDTGSNVVTNSGTIAASGLGGLQIAGGIANDGLLLANGSSILIGGDVSGSGHVELSGSSSVEFVGGSTNAVALDGGATGLIVFDHSSSFTGSISGLNGDDRLDLRDLAFSADATLSYTDDGAGGGVLTVSDGARSVQLHLLGSYDATHFTLGADGQGGLTIFG
jgi:hypothetical protein